jgi:predicted 3-demethylubiquinone-9 3-methyltransferase (glyoxalase superfamily)
VTNKVSTCLWFDRKAEEAANFSMRKTDIAGLEATYDGQTTIPKQTRRSSLS